MLALEEHFVLRSAGIEFAEVDLTTVVFLERIERESITGTAQIDLELALGPFVGFAPEVEIVPFVPLVVELASLVAGLVTWVDEAVPLVEVPLAVEVVPLVGIVAPLVVEIAPLIEVGLLDAMSAGAIVGRTVVFAVALASDAALLPFLVEAVQLFPDRADEFPRPGGSSLVQQLLVQPSLSAIVVSELPPRLVVA